MIILDANGCIRQWSRGAEVLFGWTMDEAVGQSASLLFTPEDRVAGVDQAELDTAIKRGRAADIRWHCRQDGSRVFCDGVLTTFYDADGVTVLGFGKIAREAYPASVRSATSQDTSEQSSFLAAVLASVEDAIVACDANGKLTFFNHAASRLHGGPDGSLPPEKWASQYRLYRADGATLLPKQEISLYRALGGEHVTDAEMVIATHDGTRKTVLASGRPMMDGQGQIHGAVVSMHDITSQRQAQASLEEAARETGRRLAAEASEAQLRRAEELLRLATDAAQLGIWIWNAENNTATWENMRMYEIFELPPGSDAINAATFMADCLHEDDVQPFKAAIDHTLQTGERYYFVGRFCPPSSRQVRWIELTGSLKPRTGDEPLRIIGTAADVTERKRAEELEAELDRQLHQLANSIPQLAWMADADGFIHWYNDRWYEYTGTTPHAMQGWGWQSVHVPDVLPHVIEKWRSSIATGTAFEMTFPLRGKDGTFHPFYTLVEPMKDQTGKVLQWFGTNTDVSSLHKAQEELKQASRRKDEFLAMLAHELRNPLAPIGAAAELLQIAKLDAAYLQRTGEVITRQVRHMAGLIDDLMDVSRVTRGLVKLDKTQLEIKRIVTDAIEQVRPAIEAKRHHLTIDLTPEPAHVLGDPKRLIQVLANLLDNAAKYTPEGGHIHVSAEVDKGAAHIRVSDNGAGIEPPLQLHIFELFAQGERRPDRSQGGLGIGLALVKSLVAMHDGQITCHSDGAGKGAEFTLVLPIIHTDPSQPSQTTPGKSSIIDIQKLRILVVDDNVDAADMLAAFLMEIGHDVFVEHDAKRGLERACIERPHACVLDIGLPGMDGYELARRLRVQQETAHSILVALTGYAQEQDREQAAQAGFDHHFAKPLDLSLLVAILAQLKGTG